MAKIVNIFTERFPNFGLSKLFFYILVFTLPFQTRKIFFTENSFYGTYNAFYNTFYLYLTDLVFFGLILAWLWELSRENYRSNKSYLSYNKTDRTDKTNENYLSHERSLFNRIYTAIAQDRIYQLLGLFWLILAISVGISHESILSLYGLAKFTQFFLLFAYIRENFNFSPQTSPAFSGTVRGKREKPTSRSPVSGLLPTTFWLILAASSIQAIIGIIQYIKQSSLNLAYLGEGFLRPGLSGIAEFFSHEKINPLFYEYFPYLRPIFDDIGVYIRAYGTFPHPNVLAGFLVVGFLVNLYLLYVTHKSYLSYKVNRTYGTDILLSLSLILISTGLVLTFSRLAWAVAFFGFLAWFFWLFVRVGRPERQLMMTGRLKLEEQRYFPGRLAWILFILLIALGLNWFFFGTAIKDRLTGVSISEYSPDESLTQRQFLNDAAVAMIKDKPLTGVGLKNYVVALDQYSNLAGEEFKVQGPAMNAGLARLAPHLHQPVHNIYLLVAAETGLPGLIVFLLLLFYIIRRRPNTGDRRPNSGLRTPTSELQSYTLLVISLALLSIGLFDHYLLTIQQGALLFWITLGLASVRSR